MYTAQHTTAHPWWSISLYATTVTQAGVLQRTGLVARHMRWRQLFIPSWVSSLINDPSGVACCKVESPRVSLVSWPSTLLGLGHPGTSNSTPLSPSTCRLSLQRPVVFHNRIPGNQQTLICVLRTSREFRRIVRGINHNLLTRRELVFCL